MHRALALVGGRIDALFYCPHAAEENCRCRKPKTGMIDDIGNRFSVELKEVPAVGDSLRDLQAFAKAGCQPILVLTGKGEKTLADSKAPDADVNGHVLPENTWFCNDLNEAAQRIVFDSL
jgi:D-glycero-D-manno-heptose 1,7-bisphosphate phosphatase